MKMTKLTVSGYYKTKPGTDVDCEVFDGIKVVVPHTNEEFFIRDAQRMFPVYREKHPKHRTKRYEGFIRCDVDDWEEIEGTPNCCGKDIKEMTWTELQELSCLYNIREIKLYKSCGIREARENAYMHYQEKVKGRRIFKTEIEVQRFKDEQEQIGMRLGLSRLEIQERINKVMDNAFLMIKDPDNIKNSYSFAKAPEEIIPMPEESKSK